MQSTSSSDPMKGIRHINQHLDCGEEVQLVEDVAVVPPQPAQQTTDSLEERTLKSGLITDEAQSGACLEVDAASLSARHSPPRPCLTKSNDGGCWPTAAPPSTPVAQTPAETEVDVADELKLATSTGTITQRDNLQMPEPRQEQESDSEKEELHDVKSKLDGSCPCLNRQEESSAQPVCSHKEQCLGCHSIVDLFYPERLHPALESLLYWRQPNRTVVVLIYALLFIMGITQFSVINVVAYMGLAVLLFSISWRLVQNVKYGLGLQSEPNPLDYILDMDWHLSEELILQLAIDIIVSISNMLRELKRISLCKDLRSSIRLAVILWMATYIGSWFNGLTLVFCIVLLIFSVPKLCEHRCHLQRERSYNQMQGGLHVHDDFEMGGNDWFVYDDVSFGHDAEEALDVDRLMVDDDAEAQYLGAGDFY